MIARSTRVPMGRHATREGEIDRTLRAGILVDLYAGRGTCAAGQRVEHFSIKDLELFCGFLVRR